jgi:hypothetical protein
MISQTIQLPVLTLEVSLAPPPYESAPVFLLTARHSIVRRVFGSNHRCSIYTHTLDVDFPLGFDTPEPVHISWTSRARVLHDPLDRLYHILRATRYQRPHWCSLWTPSTEPPPLSL